MARLMLDENQNEIIVMSINEHIAHLAARDAMVEFCERCDRGEVRSRYTYAKFRNILADMFRHSITGKMDKLNG